MKKGLLIAFALIISTVITPIQATNNEEAHSTSEQHNRIVDHYNDIIKYNTNMITGDAFKSDINQIDEKTIEEGPFKNEFSELNEIRQKPEGKVIEKSEDSYNSEAIVYDSSNNLYLYGKVVSDSEMLLLINGVEYTVVIDGSSIDLVSENGNRLRVYEFAPDNTENVETQTDPSSQQLFAECSSAQVSSNGSWILLAQHLKGTSTMLLQAVSEVSFMSGIVCWACQSLGAAGLGIVGGALNIVSLFSYIGEKMTVTLYTDYDKYCKGDCITYIHEYIRYYQYNNYSGYAGVADSYFHSVRPDYAGQNCLAYA